MTEASLAQPGLARHGLVDAILGGAAALITITVAQAALPNLAAPLALHRPAPSARQGPSPLPAPTAPSPTIAFAEPVPGRAIGSPFGLRQLPWEDEGRLHAGVDIAGAPGESIRVVADGVVTEVGRTPGYGHFVEVKHAFGMSSRYAHMGALAPGIAPGAALKSGAPVGQMGSTGTSTGPHLHLEMRDHEGRALNPELFLGKSFADISDLPLRNALRIPRRVRVAYVSHIPRNKAAQMEEKAERQREAQEVLVAVKALGSFKGLKADLPAGARSVGVGDDGRPVVRLQF